MKNFLILITVICCVSLVCGPKSSLAPKRISGIAITFGEFTEMEQVQTYNGQIILSSKGRTAVYKLYGTVSMICDVYIAFTGLSIGDTLVCPVRSDSDIIPGGHKLVSYC